MPGGGETVEYREAMLLGASLMWQAAHDKLEAVEAAYAARAADKRGAAAA